MSRHRAARDVRGTWQEGTSEALLEVGLDPAWIREVVVRTLAEDLGPGGVDITTAVTVDAADDRRAEVVACEDGVVAGVLLLPVVVAEAAARLGLPVPTTDLRVHDGARVEAGDVLADLRGPTRVLLVAQRGTLGLLRHLSGIATRTDRWVRELSGTGVEVVGGTATTPGLRRLEHYAVRCGGGSTGPASLQDGAHLTSEHVLAAGSLTRALEVLHRRLPRAVVQVDVRTPLEAVEAVLAGARSLLCKDMTPDVLAGAVRQVQACMLDEVEVAVGGSVVLADARRYAAAGVRRVHVEGLTGAPGALDLRVLLPQHELIPAQRR